MSLLTEASLILTPNAYKAGTLYSVVPNTTLGDMTVVRATTATRVNSAGLIESVAINVPRIDYPTLGGCPSILVEPQRTNLVLQSQTLDDAYWAKVGANLGVAPVVTANAGTAPDGTITADRVQFNCVGNSTADRSYIVSTVQSTIITTRHYQSIYVKAFSPSEIGKQLRISSDGMASSIITITADWQRIVLNGLTGYANPNFIVETRGGFTANTTADVLLWGAQFEAGSNATSYIPTVAASVTRNADVISKTGVSSLIGQTEGTIYAEINNTLMTYAAQGNVMRIFADANNEVFIRKESLTNYYTARWRANSINVYTSFTIPVINGNNKIAIAYKTGNSAIYLNGTQIGTSAATGAFSVAPSIIAIGSSSTIDFFNDRIELATVFPTRLTNAQLATLTTL